MARIYYRCEPFSKADVTLALESGVDGVIVPRAQVEKVAALSRCTVWACEDVASVPLNVKADEEALVARLKAGETACLARGWEIIPVENLLAQADNVLAEAGSLEEARLAAGILERGVDGIVVLPEALAELKAIVAQCKISQGREELQKAVITRVEPVGLGHRVCADTLSLLKRGQGMLVGNSSAFTFLVHAETEHNEYVAARPFRVNAGAVHAYARLPHDKTCYLGELAAGQEVLIVGADGQTSVATVGRVKIEVRPMLLVEAEAETPEGPKRGAVFLQNAETSRKRSARCSMADAHSPSDAPQRLTAIRGEIDSVDQELLALFNRRAALSLEVGRIKAGDPGIVFKPLREREVLDGLARKNDGPLPEEHLRAIWREIFSSSRALQAPSPILPVWSIWAMPPASTPATTCRRSSPTCTPAAASWAWCRWRIPCRAPWASASICSSSMTCISRPSSSRPSRTVC